VWIVEKFLFDDAISLPALVGQLIQSSPGAVVELELEDPSNNNVVPVNEHRA
jgi:hypothetical protein